MDERTYGIDFLYETLGKMTSQNEILKAELEYARAAAKEIEKDKDKEIEEQKKAYSNLAEDYIRADQLNAELEKKLTEAHEEIDRLEGVLESYRANIRNDGATESEEF